MSSSGHAGRHRERRHHAASAPAAEHRGGAGAGERRDERGQQRDVVGVEDATGEAEQHRGDQERATDREHPASTPIAATQTTRDEDPQTADDGEAEQPASLAAERRVQQPQRTGAATEHRARCACGTPRPPFDASESVVFKDQRKDRVAARAGHPRTVGRRGQFDQRRPRAADEQHRAAAAQQLTQRVQTSACGRSNPQPCRNDAWHDDQRHEHLRLEAEADKHAGEHQPACAVARGACIQTANGAPQRGDAAQNEQAVGVVVTRDRHGDRRQCQSQPRDEPADAPEASAHEVVHQRHGRYAHQCLRHEDAERAEAENPRRKRLHPQRQRRLVDRHDAAAVERCVEEVVPARAHRRTAAA